MIVGTCRIVLDLHGVRSLKEKRGVVRSVLSRASSKFNLATAEVEAHDEHERAVLGFAAIANERAHVNAMLDEVAAFVTRTAGVPVREHKMELLVSRPEARTQSATTSWSDFESADDALESDEERA